MTSAVATLLAPCGLRYVVEPGVIDDRSALAFTWGHCHSLALALARETGREMVALRKTQDPFDHILARADDGRLLDIGGPRASREVTYGGGRLSAVSPQTIAALPTQFGWAAADPDTASQWVPAILDRASRGEPYLTVGCFTRALNVGVLEVRLEWSAVDGAERLTAFGRPSAAPRTVWGRCGVLSIKQDAAGERLIDFCQAAFDVHADRLEAFIRRDPDLFLSRALQPTDAQQPWSPPPRRPTGNWRRRA